MKRLVLALISITSIQAMEEANKELLRAEMYYFDYQKAFNIITQAMNHGADINAQDANGETLLMKFLDRGSYANEHRYKICTVLVAAHKANPNIADNQGMTALMYAAKTGQAKECEFLIRCGADVNAKGPNEESALMIAAQANQAEACQVLLKQGADIHQTDKWKQTALHAARNNAAICLLLLQAGARIEHQNQFGETALGSAAYSNYKDTAHLLLNNGACILVDRPSRGILSYVKRAAEKGHASFCRLLLNAQALRNDCIRTLLLCINRKVKQETLICTECRKCKKDTHMQEFYRQRDKLLIPYLKTLYTPLRRVLEVKNHEGKNARDLLERYWLNASLAKNYQISADSAPSVVSTNSDGSCTIL